jgi:protein-S-isoprenylcysteine O-methyltransferase Ste14
MSKEAKPFPVPVIIGMVIFVDVFIGFMFSYLAGTWYWVDAWILLILLTPLMGITMLWLNKHNPQVLRSRTAVTGLQKQDISIMIFMVIAFVAVFLVAGLDGGLYHWSTVPLWGKLLGDIGFVIGYLIGFFLALKDNPFAAKFVRLDLEAGHHVVTTGVYAHVRHPMYAGVILWLASISIALGSLYALIPTAAVALILMVRIRFEEQFLHKNLKGYTAYTKKVTKRLIPYIW